jgi:hypothetical protein
MLENISINLSGKLTSIEPPFFIQNFMLIVVISVILFTGGMLAMTFLFGWSNKITLQDIKSLIILIVFSISVPLIGRQIFYQTNNSAKASLKINVRNIQEQKLSNNQIKITFETDAPVITYLEYKDFSNNVSSPVLPIDTLEAKTEHAFIINNVSEKGGEAYIVISGKKFGIEGKAIEIK